MTAFTTPTSENARMHLKALTDDLHQKLHRLSVFERLLDETLDVEDYLAMMQCFRTFYLQMDPPILEACHAHAARLGSYCYQPRADMFAADIVTLSGGHLDCNWDRNPVEIALPNIDSAPQLAGVVYVIDGAVLGGMVMNKAVAQLLNSADHNGRSYWDWCQLHGTQQWKSTLSLLDSLWAEVDNRAVIAAAALQTFEALNAVLQPCDKRHSLPVT